MKYMKKLLALACLPLSLIALGCEKSGSDSQEGLLSTHSAVQTTVVDDSLLNPDATTEEMKIDDIFFVDLNAEGVYDPSAQHGEKRVYGSLNVQDFLNWKDQVGIDPEYNGTLTVCYQYDNPEKSYVLCLDSACDHQGEYCSAYDSEEWDENGRRAPYPILLDSYDNAASPVIYRAYQQSHLYRAEQGKKVLHRRVCYRIDRYDISSGKRITLLTNIKGTITSLNTFGDYIYYTEENADKTVVLKRLAKTGGEPICLEQDGLKAITVLDITDDSIYYLADERYLYRADINLDNSEQLLDAVNLKSSGEKTAILRKIQNGYLYYFGDFETQNTIPNEAGISGTQDYCSCYRIPIHDLEGVPQTVAGNFVYGWIYTALTEHYFYYQPGGVDSRSEASRTLFAVNLDTLENIQVVEDCGIVINIQHIMGDKVLFTGISITDEGRDLCGNGSNYVIAYPDGRPCEKWIMRR